MAEISFSMGVDACINAYLVNVFNISASPYYAHAKSILNATRDFLDKAIVVFPMAFVLMLGEIDISVASIMALSSNDYGCCV